MNSKKKSRLIARGIRKEFPKLIQNVEDVWKLENTIHSILEEIEVSEIKGKE